MSVLADAWNEDRDFDVLVVGDLNIDLILSGLPRIPQFGEEVLASGLSQRPGGSAANFAVCCARMGLDVAFVARVGDDEFGRFLIGEMERWGVSTEFIAVDDSLQTGITVSLSGPTDRAFATYVGTIDSLRRDDVPADLMARCRHMHVASYFLQTRLQPDLPRLFADARAAGLSTSLDTGYDPTQSWDGGLLELLPNVDLFLPNEVEAPAIAEAPSVEVALATLCAMSRVVALKLGPGGAIACDGEQTIRMPAFAVEVVDTTCCGDAFNAGLLSALMEGLSLEDALRRANAAGALMASVVGNNPEALSREAVVTLGDSPAEAEGNGPL